MFSWIFGGGKPEAPTTTQTKAASYGPGQRRQDGTINEISKTKKRIDVLEKKNAVLERQIDECKCLYIPLICIGDAQCGSWLC